MARAHDLIDWLFDEQLQVDEEWAVRTDRGFTWWPDGQAQTIEVIEEAADGADSRKTPSVLLSVRTEFLSGLELTDQAAVTINSSLLSTATLCGPVYDPAKKTLELSSLVRVHEETTPFLRRAVSLACLLQIEEARMRAPELAERLGARPTVSGHPTHGLRQAPDELARALPGVLAPHSHLPCPVSEEDFAEVVETFMDQYLRNPGPFGISGSLDDHRRGRVR